ncbi:MAG: dual specificity protein phosphatase [Anaerolineae bacterium]
MALLKAVRKGLAILWHRVTEQGIRATALWVTDHLERVVSGAPKQSLSQITSQLHVGGQYRRRGWDRMAARGITAVVNLRLEFDDQVARIAPQRYLYLPTVDDTPPTMEHLRAGVDFIADEISQGGGVYVHCGSGVGRAPSMAAAYLVSTGLSPEEAWESIRAVRPFVRPRPEQVARVKEFSKAQRARG